MNDKTITHLLHFTPCFLNICKDFNKILKVQYINTDGAINETINLYHEEHLNYPQRTKLS